MYAYGGRSNNSAPDRISTTPTPCCRGAQSSIPKSGLDLQAEENTDVRSTP